MQHYLEFEKDLAALEGKATELRSVKSSGDNPDNQKEANNIEKKSTEAPKGFIY